MNALNSVMTSLFDVLLTPFEWIGPRTALVLVSGLFGVLALYAFKYISWQAGIKAAKDRIKGHMIEIRIYQDDLVVVGKAVSKVLFRNFQYVGLNFGPFIPLAIPFVLVAAQFVVRYAYDPIEVQAQYAQLMPGQGTMVEVTFADEQRAQAAEASIELSAGLVAIGPIVRSAAAGRVFQEIVAVQPGEHTLVVSLADGTQETKSVVAGDEPIRKMQPRRASARDWYRADDTELWAALWPGEPLLASDSPIRGIAIHYPHRDQGWMLDGEIGILITLVVASMLFGFAALKPLGVQI